MSERWWLTTRDVRDVGWFGFGGFFAALVVTDLPFVAALLIWWAGFCLALGVSVLAHLIWLALPARRPFPRRRRT